jgi:membrane-associated protease RseP (regulator of RpoE activity)
VKVLLIVLGCAYLCSVLHLIGFILVSRIWKVRIEAIGFLHGPVLLHRTWKGVRFELRAIPYPGSFVKFVGDEQEDMRPDGFMAVHPVARSLIVLGGPLCSLFFAAALLGPIRANASFRHGVIQFIVAAWSHARFNEILSLFVRFVETSPWWVVLGVVSAKVAAFNTLPLPVLNGGQAWMNILQWKQPNTRTTVRLQWIGLLTLVTMYGSYLVALISWSRKG